MRKVEIYERALCCSTGVCGPSVDDDLVRTTNVEREVNEASGDAEIIRYNLASNPKAFAHKPEIKAILEKEKINGLPIIMINGEIVKHGAYPSFEEFEEYTQMKLHHSMTVPED
ncbi:arsenite efflux transporter metallochaperone ArsD [Companilactobacillus sp.]|jgi:hypothetical protein|uniref:arsenite efflux transporter metallochaperone ArsD n=1 Tax=Companilactobacillus sp. TaxID=2767905 RepID=UPI0025C34D68|nr:arsenite efflux transporter metallochaperone ArsD [Companilactobacillus sp.]MCH4009873.1 arsenite efflux transporter metallochaperone ArsD [Companilactobacillus sp.]MCH4052451.1 arsenite efflux transporter metallochaperone ArsD [Companilactobacillus sp.]MCH4077815.1 arsenite efflux transporter metallochaperone ArsD [Companilactobacillus sp.]MCH4126391.1 arsenite efflux transporter metallochaperone ArsD [Companilactobacillus sp.]MCI1312713.1 arsenite efflux transporter metallochaperone ArsD 